MLKNSHNPLGISLLLSCHWPEGTKEFQTPVIASPEGAKQSLRLRLLRRKHCISSAPRNDKREFDNKLGSNRLDGSVPRMRRGVTLTELLLAVMLAGLLILTVASLEMASRSLFGRVSKASGIQDEALIAMEHIVKHVQLGIGWIDDHAFTISNNGTRIQVQLDDLDNPDGKFDSSNDREIAYYTRDYKIVYDPNVHVVGDEEELTDAVVYDCKFSDISNKLNQAGVSITTRKEPQQKASLENPQTILSSRITLRAMSCF